MDPKKNQQNEQSPLYAKQDKNGFTSFVILISKGMAMGGANIIPGVSGGTMALLLGVFERLVDAIKSWDIRAVKLLFTGQWKSFTQKTDFYFLVQLFLGILLAVLFLARLLGYLFEHHPVYVWAFFFGLILASAYYVGQEIKKWSPSIILFTIIGLVSALILTFLTPSGENTHFLYLMLCGAVAIASMILPGLSGSYVLLLMGNYQLVAIKAINGFMIHILVPFTLGMGVGIIAFSHLLSFILKRWRYQTIGLLTGFILGSLGTLWPWKKTLYLKNAAGELILRKGQPITSGYDYFFPSLAGEALVQFLVAITLAIAGYVLIVIIERMAQQNQT